MIIPDSDSLRLPKAYLRQALSLQFDRPQVQRGANFECLVYWRQQPVDTLTLDDYCAQAWPILQGIETSTRCSKERLEVKPMKPTSTTIATARLAAKALSVVPIPKSLADLFYYHALLTDMEAACEPSKPGPEVRWRHKEQMLAYGLSCANGLSSPSAPLTHHDIDDTMWQVLQDFEMTSAVPNLAVNFLDSTREGLIKQLEERINDRRFQAAAWKLNQHALSFMVQTCSIERPMSNACLIRLSVNLLSQVNQIESRLQQNQGWKKPLEGAWPAFGSAFFAADSEAWPQRRDLYGSLILNAIQHEMAAPPNVFSFFRSADLYRDIQTQQKGESHSLSLSTSAMTGALFDAPSGCSTSVGVVRRAHHFYALDVPIEGPAMSDLFFFPPLRGIHRMVESGEWLHPRMKAAPAGPDPAMWRGANCTSGRSALDWSKHLFISPQTASEAFFKTYIKEHSTILTNLDGL